MSKKIKIVLDSDVLIHFSKGNCLSLLPKIFPEYECIILSVVYKEISYMQKEIDTNINTFHKFSIVDFPTSRELLKEYAKLTKKYGKGESACMSYCKYNNDIIGSSNIKDVKDYCENEGITLLTTIDFLYYAYIRKLMTVEECNSFITIVKSKGSKLPNIDIAQYTCNKI
jgi:rRNA-processing protein FCF1